MSAAAGRNRPRRPWLTVPLYVMLLAVVAVDVWAFLFWSAVGGSLGWTVAAAAALVAVLAGVLLATDARRQWRLHRATGEERS